MHQKYLRYLSKSIESKNLVYLSLDKFFRIFLGFFIVTRIAKHFGPEDYGQFALIMSIIAILTSIVSLGNDEYIVGELVSKKFDVGRILGSLLVLRLGLSIFCIVLSVIYIRYQNINQTYYLISSFSLLFVSFDVFDLFNQSNSRNGDTISIKLSSYVFINFVKLAILLTFPQIIYFYALTSIEVLINAVGLLIQFISKSKIKLKFSFERLVNIFLISLPLVLSNLSISIFMRADIFFLNKFASRTDVGVYSVATQLVQLFHFIPSIISISVLPILINKYNTDNKNFDFILIKIFRLYVIFGCFITTCFYFFSSEIIDIFYGKGYQNSILIMKLYSISLPFYFLGTASSIWFVAKEKLNLIFYKSLLGLLVSIVSCYLLIPQFGIISAAAIYVGVQSIVCVFSNILFAKELFYLQFKIFKFHG